MASTKSSYPSLEERVKSVLEHYEIKELPNGIYTMKAPDAQEAYTVDTKNNRCTCPAGQKGKPCKHLAAAKKLLKEKTGEMDFEEALKVVEWLARQGYEKLLDLSDRQKAKALKAVSIILLAYHRHVVDESFAKLLE